jgi:hypothetical protein
MSVESARRSRAREKERRAANPTATIIKEVRCGRLSTLTDWRREIGRVYRAMRTGKLAPDDATKLTYVANVAAKLVHLETELRELQALRERLAQLQGTQAIECNGAATAEYLPATALTRDEVEDDEDAVS